jgi:carboxylesterase type B
MSCAHDVALSSAANVQILTTRVTGGQVEGVRTTSPNGANHGAEVSYVFLDPGFRFGGIATTPRPEDVKMAELMASYLTNFAKTGIPTPPACPIGPRSLRPGSRR